MVDSRSVSSPAAVSDKRCTPFQRAINTLPGCVDDRLVVDAHSERLRPQALALASGAGPAGHESLNLLPLVVGLRLSVPSLQVRDDAFKCRAESDDAPSPRAVPHLDLLEMLPLARAIKEKGHLLRR